MSGKEYAQAGASEEGKEACQKPQSQALTTTVQPSSAPSNDTPPVRDSSPDTVPTPEATTNAPPKSAAAQDRTTSEPTRSQTGSIAHSPGTESVTEAAQATVSAHASTGIEFRQPDPPFEQPARTARVLAQAVPMTDHGREIAARLKETFYAYSNRLDRNQQTTLGPSEIGSPCDRRIAMSLLRVAPVNPGGDNWASFVGTCVHAGLAEMFLWANAGTGRYAVEVPLKFPNPHVPHGTGDLLDRTLCMFLDHKLMGRWSLDKLTTKGPIPTYRVQVHTYAYGARLKGEKVDHVAIIGWPREAGTLDDLYVWTEPYDPSVAIDALARVERIAKQVSRWRDDAPPLDVARSLEIADDCRYCPFHAPKDDQGERGCNGRR
ncbi:hypothetical protein [Streptomyces turgidiscabies]|uniref:hypothetical protein n=1 Tax=Streptomyces turgidiscabies TaxID=85558 RepID=UPI0038F645E4